HANSLQNRIIGSDVNGKQAAIMTDGGSFDAIGDVLTANSGGYLFWLGPGTQEHDDLASGAKSESVADLLYVASGASGAVFAMTNSDLKIGSSNSNMIDWEDTNSNDRLAITNSHFGEGVPGAAYVLKQNAAFMDDRIGVNTISFNSSLEMWDVKDTSQVPTLTNLGGGRMTDMSLLDPNNNAFFGLGYNNWPGTLSDFRFSGTGTGANSGLAIAPSGPCGATINLGEGTSATGQLGGVCGGNTWQVTTPFEAASIKNDCAGQATLASGAATVTNACIATGRPIICTDNTDTTAVPCTAIPSAGSLAIHGTGTDTVSWAQF
ncbi:MAG: hypothetical protein ACREP6_08025, partial [Candidatus Binataceae bacterium]